MNKTIAVFAMALAILASVRPTEAQQAGKVYRIGYLSQDSAKRDKNLLAAFRHGLQELGYLEGKNILIEERYSEGKRHRLPALAAELARLKVDIIVAAGGVPAAKKATSTIPIVMAYSADPVGSGYVASLARPGGNVTGLSDFHGDLISKRIELLKEIVPSASPVAVLFPPRFLRSFKNIQDVAPALGVTVLPWAVKGPDDIDRAFAVIREERPGGLLQLAGVGRWRKQIINLTAKSKLPAIYTHGGWVAAGGLMSYGSNWPDLFRRAATYVDKILKGAKPANLPVEQPIKFDLTINLKTAKALGVAIAPEVLYQATKVIK